MAPVADLIVRQHDAMSFIPQSRAEWIIQMKLAVFILSLFGYLFFLAAGWSTSLGVFHNPGYCWVASAIALLAFVVGSGSQRWAALAALVVAILVGVYGYHDNAVWREKIKQMESRKSACVLVTGLLVA
jgi:uncharacterized membrane protein